MRDLRAVLLPLLTTVLGFLPACASPPLDPDDPTLLARPFTAAQIAAAMPAGRVIELEQSQPMGKGRLRWTVVEADDDGCVIEYAPLDADGAPVGEARRVRHGWTELRDHASFPVETSTVEDDRRLTPLGLVDGRTYTTTDAESGTVTRMFFSPMFPGPPLWFETTRGRQLVQTMQQTARR
ncbi:MAG: hypothetical protein ACF8XB_14780 [Planctomycetota bacterium JB042]